MPTQNSTVITANQIPAIQAEARKSLPPEALPPDTSSAQTVPQGFPEKFIVDGKPDYEALFRSYVELEKKQSTASDGKPDEGQAQGDESSKEGGDEKPKEEGDEKLKDVTGFMTEADVSRYTQEFAENGDLSEESIKQITEQYKIPRALVEAHLAGLRHTAEVERSRLLADIGGQDAYDAMAEWARENLSAEELKAYDSVVTGKDLAAAKLAINGMYARYQAAGHAEPKQVFVGKTSATSVSGFRSAQELTHAVSDPRYRTDPAYRADVEARLRASRF